MSLRYSRSASNGQPADDVGDGPGPTTPPADEEGGSSTTGTGAVVPPAADDETVAPTRPTFTARPNDPAAAAVPEPAFAPDDAAEDYAAELEIMVPAEPATADGPAQPLLSDAAELRVRWQHAQTGFVDDPREAVGEAADLIEQTAQALVIALRQQQRELRVMWERGPADPSVPEDGEPAPRASDTEHLRLMMRRYRTLFDQLCRP